MLNVRLAGGHLYGKQLFTWLSLVVSLTASFCAVLFIPLDVSDEIRDVNESVSEEFLTYSLNKTCGRYEENTELMTNSASGIQKDIKVHIKGQNCEH